MCPIVLCEQEGGEGRRYPGRATGAYAGPGFVEQFSGSRCGFTCHHPFFEEGVVRSMEILPNNNYCY